MFRVVINILYKVDDIKIFLVSFKKKDSQHTRIIYRAGQTDLYFIIKKKRTYKIYIIE